MNRFRKKISFAAFTNLTSRDSVNLNIEMKKYAQ